MRKKIQIGFTLVEVMIVVAIISILAAIAVPAYRGYTIRTQSAAALSELAPLKARFELMILENKTPSLIETDVGYIGQTTNGGGYCKLALTTSTIECTTKGGDVSKFNGKRIIMTRSGGGVWGCTSDFDALYRPEKCN